MRHKAKPFDAAGIPLLERLRRYHGYTLREMASRTGLSRPALGRVFGGRWPEVRAALALARLFSVTVEDLWGGPEHPGKSQAAKEALTDGRNCS